MCANIANACGPQAAPQALADPLLTVGFAISQKHGCAKMLHGIVFQTQLAAVLAWCVITAVVCVVLARMELVQLRDAFDTDARIAHRLLSQRAVQHDAVIAMLALLQPPPAAAQPAQRLPSVYLRSLALVSVSLTLPAPIHASRRLKRCSNYA